MKNKDTFCSYETAERFYQNSVVPKYGATRLPWGFGKWLWMDYNDDEIRNWEEMKRLGILTTDGCRRLAKAKGGE